jgi:hypothetical protein
MDVADHVVTVDRELDDLVGDPGGVDLGGEPGDHWAYPA